MNSIIIGKNRLRSRSTTVTLGMYQQNEQKIIKHPLDKYLVCINESMPVTVHSVLRSLTILMLQCCDRSQSRLTLGAPWAEIRRTGAHKPVLRCCYLRVLCWQVQLKPKQTPHCSSRGSAVFSTAIEVTLRLSALSCHWQPVRCNYRKNSLTTNVWATVIFSFGLITHFSVHIHILKYISNENVVIVTFLKQASVWAT